MADLKFNFSSQWPTIQVVKVVASPDDSGDLMTDSPYERRHRHGLGYPPLVIGMGLANGTESYRAMIALDVDEQYFYTPDVLASYDSLECAVVYAVDISQSFTYDDYDSALATPLLDETKGTLDLRKFLLHSRAVGPMLLNVSTKNFTSGDTTLTYTSPLDYPTFSFGFVHTSPSSSWDRKNIWINAPLAGQAYPVTTSNGFSTSVSAENIADQDKGSVIVLRNPAIITHNEVTVSI